MSSPGCQCCRYACRTSRNRCNMRCLCAVDEKSSKIVAGIAEREGSPVDGPESPSPCSVVTPWNVASSMTRRTCDHEADCSMITGAGIHSIVQQ